MNARQHECYDLIADIRRYDCFPAGPTEKELVNTFFPKTVSDLTKDLSNVTAAFYGIFLESLTDVVAGSEIDSISRKFFHRLGRMKTAAILNQYGGLPILPADARGIAIVLISAIYNASPEYNFTISHYAEDRCVITLTGKDRYYRIATQLGIEQLLTWPTLTPFFEGINDELELNCDITPCVRKLAPDGSCDIEYNITVRN